MTVWTDGIHLVADSMSELHAFAFNMGLRREWFQDHLRHPHYDLTTTRALRRALDKGAKRTPCTNVVRMSHSLRNHAHSAALAASDDDPT